MRFVFNPAIFRAYDIRGVVDVDLSIDGYGVLGRGLGTVVRGWGGRRVVVGHDARATSAGYAAALIAGLRACGCDVADLGLAPTPLVSFAQAYLRADAAAVITASHNPPQYNGLKLRQRDEHGGAPWSSAAIQQLRVVAESGAWAVGDGAYQQVDLREAYVADAVRHWRLPAPMHVALDAGNGVAGPLALQTLAAIGCTVDPLYIEPDGTFPNHHPDPSNPANLTDLAALVRKRGAALGLALDGDGDRLGAVDETGAYVAADRLLIVLAQHLLRQGPAPIVFDVTCSGVLGAAITASGGTPILAPTGYPHQSAAMRAANAPLAGERSGHIFSALPNHCFDDGIFAACFLAHALAAQQYSLAAALAPFPALPSHTDRHIPFSDEAKWHVIDDLRAFFAQQFPVSTVDGVRIDCGDGWALVRASNTEAAVMARFEAATPARVQAIRSLVFDRIAVFRAATGNMQA